MSRYRANLVEGPLASLIVFIIPAAHLILSEVESVAADLPLVLNCSLQGKRYFNHL